MSDITYRVTNGKLECDRWSFLTTFLGHKKLLNFFMDVYNDLSDVLILITRTNDPFNFIRIYMASLDDTKLDHINGSRWSNYKNHKIYLFLLLVSSLFNW